MNITPEDEAWADDAAKSIGTIFPSHWSPKMRAEWREIAGDNPTQEQADDASGRIAAKARLATLPNLSAVMEKVASPHRDVVGVTRDQAVAQAASDATVAALRDRGLLRLDGGDKATNGEPQPVTVVSLPARSRIQRVIRDDNGQIVEIRAIDEDL